MYVYLHFGRGKDESCAEQVFVCTDNTSAKALTERRKRLVGCPVYASCLPKVYVQFLVGETANVALLARSITGFNIPAITG